jgi:XTP/dITP diphosphohydrolase
MSRLRLVCASANPDKVAEIEAILGTAVELLPRPPDIPDVAEDADTLEGNARLKAAAVAAATGAAAVADDTGLEVDALGGLPGVRTARYAGEHATYAENRAKLLAALDGSADRRARFHTVAMVLWPDGREVVAQGRCDGTIATTERGERGFGYDAVFVPDGGGGRTFAEMSEDEKHALSHRGRALNALLGVLAAR